MRANGKLSKFFHDSMGYLSILALAAVYLLTSFITITAKDKTPVQIIIDGFAFTALSMAMDRLFSLQGYRSGERDERVIATSEAHGAAVQEAAEWFDKLEAWCNQKTMETLRGIRQTILACCGLCYDKLFDENGEGRGYYPAPIPPEIRVTPQDNRRSRREKGRLQQNFLKSEAARERCYMRACRVTLTPLTPGTLTGTSGKVSDPYNFGTSTLAHERQESKTGALLKAVMMFVIGYWGVELIENFSYEILLLRALQISLALALGVIRMYRSYMYVTEEQRGNVVKKIDCLQMFVAAMKREEREHGESGCSQGQNHVEGRKVDGLERAAETGDGLRAAEGGKGGSALDAAVSAGLGGDRLQQEEPEGSRGGRHAAHA